MHVVLAAGGTAGHIFPALNTAAALRELRPDVAITIIGTYRGLDQVLVPPSGFPLMMIDSVPFPRTFSADALRFPHRMYRAVAEVKRFLSEHPAHAVVGFGGYASAPVYVAARARRVCTIVHEANSTAGLANRLGARLTRNIALNYPGVLPHGRVIGMPLSASIADLDRAHLQTPAREYFGLPSTGPVLLVFGGSQGAQSMNATVTEALPALVSAGISVLHAVGPSNAPSIDILDTADSVYRAVPFIDRMDLAYAAADLSINRAGAMTVAEIASTGLPSIFVPLPIGNGEQERNAHALVEAGGALMCRQQDFSPSWVTSTVIPLARDTSRLASMSTAVQAGSYRGAAQELAHWALACERD